MEKYKINKIAKRAMDIAGAAALVCVTSPVMILSSALVVAESPGSPLFIHERVGKDGKPIRILKFRSMKPGSDDLEAALNDKDLEEYYQEFKLKDDPRITEIGRLLRRTSLDELPQLFNVIRGDMSLVGPRPVMKEELVNYTEEEQKRLLSAKPGLTGYWQVFARNDATYQSGRRQKMELWYTEHQSLLLDMCLLALTPFAVLRKNG